jgi:DNA-binding GntR family transcriptional regulator
MPKNIEEHAEVITAFSRRDAERARRLMERHILGAGEYLMEHLRRAQPAGILV